MNRPGASGGATVGGGGLAARCPYGLNDVQGWGLGEGYVGGGGGQPLRTNLPPYYKAPKQFLQNAYLETSELKGSRRVLPFIPFLKRKVKCVRRKIGQGKNRI